MDDRDDPIDTATAHVVGEYPGATAAFVGGSVIRGEGTPTSDLDMVIVLGEPADPHRATYVRGGWVIESFVHTADTLRLWSAAERLERKPVLAQLVGEGEIVIDRGGAVDLQREMRSSLSAGPPPLTSGEIDDYRYGITDLLDDLVDSPPGLERLSVATRIVDALVALHLESAGRWSGRGKWAIRRVGEHDPERARALERAALQALDSPDALRELAEEWLVPHSGRLTAGYRQDGSARTARLRLLRASAATDKPGSSAPEPAGTGGPIYDRIGGGYAGRRVADPRWAVRIERALGGARSVVNVGAGTGNYEPEGGVSVTAVEPSGRMLAQRTSSAPSVRAVAEALPFPDETFDAAMAVLTIHHWTDRDRGLRELARVSGRQVLLVYEPEISYRFWLLDYFPEVLALDIETDPPTPDNVGAVLDVVDVQTLPIPADCTDGVAAAYWRRPTAYLDPAVQQTTSILALLDDDAIRRGTARLRRDLDDGSWHRRHGDLLGRDEADFGYRLVIAEGRGGGAAPSEVAAAPQLRAPSARE